LLTRKLTNPVFGLPGVSVRDPAAVWHDGVCALFYTRNVGGWTADAGWEVGSVTTQDFGEFSQEVIITPRGYASPGNVVRAGGQWVLPVQSYPWPSEIALLFSDDLIHWSEPKHVIPADTGPGWDAAHGPIDGWLLRHDGAWRCIWTNRQAGTDHLAFGMHESTDLEEWQNLTPEGPFIDSAQYNDNGGAENCAVLAVDGRWHFFASVGMNPQRLAHVSADTGSAWPRLGPEAELALPAQAWCAHSQCAVFVDDWREVCGEYVMLYHGIDTLDSEATLGMALSVDLERWRPLPEGELPRHATGHARGG